MNNSFEAPFFPKQAIPSSKKTKQWYKDNIDVGVSIVEREKDSGLRSSRADKISNVNLFNDIIDKREVEAAINPYNLSGKFPDTYKNYPIANSKLNLLFGEERKRLFNPVSYVINSDIINSEQEIVTNKFKNLLASQVMDESFSKEDAEKAIKNLDKWRKYTFQDSYGRMSNQVIQYFLNSTDMPEQFSKCFEDLLIQGEEIASIDIVGDKLVFERLDPLDVYTFRNKDSYMLEDADWIVVSKFIPIGEVIDNYRDYLSKEDKEYLEEIYTTKTEGSRLFPDGQLMNDRYDINESLKYIGLDKALYSGPDGVRVHNKDFDDQGNIRVTRTLWKGQRRVGVLSFKDEEGTIQKKYVDEKYKPNVDLGETIKWEYISEWNEGTKIGRGTYVKYGPRPVQFRDPDNISLCHSGIVGNILTTNSSRSKSLFGYMKSYQMLYNFFMYRLQQDFMKFQGHIAGLNTALVPDGWSMDKVMYYVQQFGFMVQDPFNEGQSGASQGKLVGHLNTPPSNIQIGDANIIQMNMMMLDFLEQRIADISGVTPQRQGAIQNRETKGGVERSVMQSSNNTEKYFSLHDNFRLRCLKVLVGTATVAWKDKKEKRTYVLDDSTKAVLDFDGEKFREGTYGIATNTSSDVTNMMNDIKGLSEFFMQNGGSISAIMDIYSTKDPMSLKRKMQQYEEELKQEQQEERKAQQEMNQRQIQAQVEIEQKKLDHEKELHEMDNNAKIQIEAMKQSAQDDSLETSKLVQKSEKEQRDLNLKERQISETERHNRATESIARSKPSPSASK